MVGAGKEGGVPLWSLRLEIHDQSRDLGAPPSKRGGMERCKSARSQDDGRSLGLFDLAGARGERDEEIYTFEMCRWRGGKNGIWTSQGCEEGASEIGIDCRV